VHGIPEKVETVKPTFEWRRFSDAENVGFGCKQGDRIGRIFAQGAILYFG
jgi:hypothetical protein